MSFVKYTREELFSIIPILLESEMFPIPRERDKDSYPHSLYSIYKKKRNDLLDLKLDCEDPKIEELELNKAMWKILGSGIGLYLFIIVPIERIPLLINTYKGTPDDIIIKIRLQIGK
jgi:hypothetical protein